METTCPPQRQGRPDVMLRKTSHYGRLPNFSSVPTLWHELFFKGICGGGGTRAGKRRGLHEIAPDYGLNWIITSERVESKCSGSVAGS